DKKAGGLISDPCRVHDAEERRVQGEEGRVALAPGDEQVSVRRDGPVPVPVPAGEDGDGAGYRGCDEDDAAAPEPPAADPYAATKPVGGGCLGVDAVDR